VFLRLLMSEAEPSDEVIGATPGMPVGATGPTRRRCRETLRLVLVLDLAHWPTVTETH
jgi:hypothetical protein